MKRPSPSLPAGFTLVEILVSLTVLTLIVFMVSNIINSASKSVGSGTQRISAASEARAIFNRMAIDFGRMVRRADVDCVFKSDAFPQGTGGIGVNDECAFYASVPGTAPAGAVPADVSSTSLVAYKLAANAPTPYSGRLVFQRLSMSLGWTTGGGLTAMAYLPVLITIPPGSSASGTELFPGLLPDPTSLTPTTNYDAFYQVIGEQVFRMEYTYLLKDSSTPFSITPWKGGGSKIDGFKDVAAIIVALGVLDSDSRNRVSDYGKLVQALPNAVNNADILSQWLPVLNSGNFASSAAIPESVAGSVRVYQRYFYLDSK